MATQPQNRSNISLMSCFLLIAALAAAAGWYGAERKVQLAWEQAVEARRLAEFYEAQLGILKVVDETKVHAIGLSGSNDFQYRWQWRVFLPPTKSYRLHMASRLLPTSGTIRAQDQEISEASAQLIRSGEILVEAIVQRESEKQWALICQVDGQFLDKLALIDFEYGRSYDNTFTVSAENPSVWEPGEFPALLMARILHGDFHASEVTERCDGLAVWLEELP